MPAAGVLGQLLRLERLGDKFLRVGPELAAVDSDHALFAVEEPAAVGAIGKLHDDAAGVFHEDLRVNGLALAGAAGVGLFQDRRLERLALGPNLHRTAVVHAQCPLDHVEPVAAPACHLAAGELLEADPTRLGPGGIEVRVVGRGHRSAPHFPVDAVGHRLGGQVAGPGAGVVLGDYLFDLPGPARPNHRAADDVRLYRPLLAAGLEDALVLADGLDDLPALGYRQRHGLFGVDILACLGGMDAHKGPPVVVGGRHDGVDVLALKQFPVVLVSFRAVLLRPLAGTRKVHVRDGDHGVVAVAGNQPAALAADADIAQADPVVGARLAWFAQHVRRYEHGRRHNDGCGRTAAQERPAGGPSCGYLFMRHHDSPCPES